MLATSPESFPCAGQRAELMVNTERRQERTMLATTALVCGLRVGAPSRVTTSKAEHQGKALQAYSNSKAQGARG